MLFKSQLPVTAVTLYDDCFCNVLLKSTWSLCLFGGKWEVGGALQQYALQFLFIILYRFFLVTFRLNMF